MKAHTHFFKTLTAILMVMVLVFVVVGQQNMHPAKHESKQPVKNSQVISEQSVEVLVPSHAFDFQPVSFHFPTEISFEVPQIKCSKYLTKPFFSIPYFDKLFTHHIVSQAP